MPPKLIGITGGIGSGKSLVSRVLQVLDFFVYNSDQSARKLVYNESVQKQLIESFGENAFDSEGRYNRSFIADQVFSDVKKLQRLNDIIHPAVQQDFEEWVLLHKDQKFLFKEAAILFETGSYNKLDATILVTAPESLRVDRVMGRDGANEKDIRSRMEKQWSDDKKSELADFIIQNDDQTMVIPQIYDILNAL